MSKISVDTARLPLLLNELRLPAIGRLWQDIAARYERRSLMITANQPFGDWGKVFPDPAMTVAAIDRLVHHATIFEMNVESYRRRTAVGRKLKAELQPADAPA
jgi:DNA replication protein DnaC